MKTPDGVCNTWSKLLLHSDPHSDTDKHRPYPNDVLMGYEAA
jgi:hypothetical protein